MFFIIFGCNKSLLFILNNKEIWKDDNESGESFYEVLWMFFNWKKTQEEKKFGLD